MDINLAGGATTASTDLTSQLGELGRDSGSAGTPASSPSDGDAARFGAAMDAPPTAPEVNPLGDGLAERLGGFSDRIQAGRQQALDVINKGDVSQVDLLRVQFAMGETSLLSSLGGKFTEKITQALSKLQQG